MEEYEFTVILTVRVKAYDESDARDSLLEIFGPGEDCGVDVMDTKITKE